MRVIRVFMVLTIGLVLSACADKGLKQIRPTGEGPDEFLVLPVKPLQQPESYAALPAPTPGGVNRADTNPNGEAIAALGGNASLVNPGQIPGSEARLVTQASRYGVDSSIRGTLAQEDADFRRRKQRFTNIRLVPVDRYNQAYQAQALDAPSEAARYRAAGAITPSSPPVD